jgi:hypothetical protein
MPRPLGSLEAPRRGFWDRPVGDLLGQLYATPCRVDLRRGGSTQASPWIISAQPRQSAARSAPCGVAAPSVASTGKEASWVRDLHQDPGHEVHGVDPLVLDQLGLVPRRRLY